MLSVSFIKLVPHSESLIKALGNLGILFGQVVPVVHGLIQKREILRKTGWQHPIRPKNDKSEIKTTRYRKALDRRRHTLVNLKLHCI